MFWFSQILHFLYTLAFSPFVCGIVLSEVQLPIDNRETVPGTTCHV